jgi:environmental stress-induced protein Ves
VTIRRFQRADLPVQRWKNGGGVTREVVCQPVGSDMAGFDWRVSIAHIASSGPFSAFPGVDRVITLLEGAGVVLHSNQGAVSHRLDLPMMPFSFPGDAPVQADLLGTDCHDFNVMTRRARCTARVGVWRSPARLPTKSHGLLFAGSGHWQTNGQTLLAGEGLSWHNEPIAWTLAPDGEDAALIAVLIEYLA